RLEEDLRDRGLRRLAEAARAREVAAHELVDRVLRQLARRAVDAGEAPEALDQDPERDHRAHAERIDGEPPALQQFENELRVQDQPPKAGRFGRAMSPDGWVPHPGSEVTGGHAALTPPSTGGYAPHRGGLRVTLSSDRPSHLTGSPEIPLRTGEGFGRSGVGC